MRLTRSSTRLASAEDKGKEAKEIEDEDVDQPMQFDEVFDEEPKYQLPSPKRQRTSIKHTKGPTRKKQVRGKQGGLAGLINMPIDIFTEIASHLFPGDIISLSRSNRFFRGLLLARSSGHIWHSAMRNVRGLPPCPDDLSEPQFLSLLFSKHCTMCGQAVRCRMDEILRVRLCTQCRNERLVPLHNLMFEVRSLVHHSSKIVPSKRRWGPDVDYALMEEAREAERKYKELKNGGDPLALASWESERKTDVGKRLREAIVIQAFLDNLGSDREQELRELKHTRRRDIENRLAELGWDKKDMQFTYNFPARREWYSLVEQTRPLTDRGKFSAVIQWLQLTSISLVWSNIQPKLIPILEANREARLKKEKSERQSARRVRLTNLLNEIKKSQAPVLDITVRAPTNPEQPAIPDEPGDASQAVGSSGVFEAQIPNITGETSSNASQLAPASDSGGAVTPPPIHTTFRGIFPDIVDALEWPMINSLFETDTSVSAMEQNFIELRSEVEAAIDDWKLATHARMAKMLRQDEEIEGELLTPRLIVRKGDNDSDPFTSLSQDLKLLLRADSLFTSNPNGTARRDLSSYDMALPRFGYRLAFNDGMMSRPYKPPVDLSRIRVCSEARQVARVLLVHMSLENCSMVELKSVGRGFACGRCHDSRMKTWEELISHFVEAKEVVDRVQERAEALDAIFRDVHDPDVFPGRSLVKYTPSVTGGQIRTCTICSKDPISQDVRAPEAKIIEHLEDVHDVTEPKLGTHFVNSSLPHPHGFDPSWHFDFDLGVGLFFTPIEDSESEGLDTFWDGDFW